MDEVKSYVNMRIFLTTHSNLKELATLKGQPMTDVLDALVRQALIEARASHHQTKPSR